MYPQQIKRKAPRYRLAFKVLSGAGGSFFYRVTGAVLAFVTQAFVARILNVESFGYFAYAITWLGLLGLGGKMGFDTSSVRFIPPLVNKKNWRKLADFLRFRSRIMFVSNTLIGVFALLIIYLCRSALSHELAKTLAVMVFILPLLSFIQIYEESLRALQRIWTAQFAMSIMRPLTFIVLCFFVMNLGLDVQADKVMMVNLLAFALSSLLAYFLWKRATPLPANAHLGPDWESRRVWFHTSKTMLLVSGFTVILFQTDTILLGILSSTTSSGIYFAVSKVASLSVFVLTAINFVVGPMFSRLYAEAKVDELQNLVSVSLRLATGAALLISLCALLVGDDILWLFGREFRVGYVGLLILTLGQLLNALTGPVGLLLNMTSFQTVVARTMALGAGANIVLNLLLIPNLGLEGAAIATASTNAFVNFRLATKVKQHLGIKTFTTLFSKG